MMKIENADKSSSAGTNDEQRTEADNSTSVSLLPNPMLSAALSEEEGNKLIAKFMDEYDLYHWGRDPFNELLTATYHSSWNKLMPVVEKIEMLHWNDRNNQFNPPLEFFLQNEIEFVWNHVVKFLKWYNLNAVSVGSR